MQLFNSIGSSKPGQPQTFGCRQATSGLRYGASLHRRNENGLLAVVERHRDEIRRSAMLPPPAAPGGP